MLLKGKTAVVTGSNRGIGRAIVEAFAQNGATVWAHARKETLDFRDDMEALAAHCNVEIRPIYFDMRDSDTMNAAVRTIASSQHRVNVLVNNAGVAHGGLFQMTSLRTIHEVFDVNLFSALHFTQVIVRLMQKTGSGSIINIGSTSGVDLNAGNVAYGVSKAALMAATKTLARELGPLGIRVNAIAPGLTDTDMAKLVQEQAGREMVDRTAMKRLAHPREIATVAVFFASDMASFVTGQVLRVDGGAG